MSKQYKVVDQDGQKWLSINAGIDSAILGCRAYSTGGGYWAKVGRGWKWANGSTFPRPGGDWNGDILFPYLGSHPAGTILKEDQVMEVKQWRDTFIESNWENGNSPYDQTWEGIETRTVFTDAEPVLEKTEPAEPKMTFGLTDKNMRVIERNLARFEDALYSCQVWEDIGKEIGWMPLAAALWYFRKKELKTNPRKGSK